jgi:hypothetical protein
MKIIKHEFNQPSVEERKQISNYFLNFPNLKLFIDLQFVLLFAFLRTRNFFNETSAVGKSEDPANQVMAQDAAE